MGILAAEEALFAADEEVIGEARHLDEFSVFALLYQVLVHLAFMTIQKIVQQLQIFLLVLKIIKI